MVADAPPPHACDHASSAAGPALLDRGQAANLSIPIVTLLLAQKQALCRQVACAHMPQMGKRQQQVIGTCHDIAAAHAMLLRRRRCTTGASNSRV